jgi:hypothetical protein
MNETIVFTFVTGRQFPIIKNPNDKDYEFIRNRFKALCPFAPKGEPYSRSTYDNKGNMYLWCSDDSMHRQVEKFLSEKFNVRCNQDEYCFN